MIKHAYFSFTTQYSKAGVQFFKSWIPGHARNDSKKALFLIIGCVNYYYTIVVFLST